MRTRGRTRENKCQISQNDILHLKFSEFCLCFHTSCEMGCIDDSATGVQETGVCCRRLFFHIAFISELLALICSYCHCSSISDLLCGCVEVNLSETSAKDNPEDSRQTFNTLFPSGLFKHILDYLKPYLLKDTWKKSPLARHVLVWCTLGLKV